ncbi:MAG: hypothetical protein AAB217_13825 [Chloroflexota bacterium]
MDSLSQIDQPKQMKIPGRIFGLTGGIWGLVAGLALGGLRFALSETPLRGAEWIGDLAFLAVYVAPFALALIALRWKNPAHRAMAWMAGSTLALLGAFTAFSGVSLVFLPATVLLGIAALQAIASTALRNIAVVFIVATGVIALNAGALFVLFAREDPQCWELIRSADGRQEWQAAPFTFTGAISASGVGPVGRVCTSDMISPAEGILSLGLLSLGAIGLSILLPRWHTRQHTTQAL